MSMRENDTQIEKLFSDIQYFATKRWVFISFCYEFLFFPIPRFVFYFLINRVFVVLR